MEKHLEITESQLDELANAVEQLQFRISTSNDPLLVEACERIGRSVWRLTLSPLEAMCLQYESALERLASTQGKEIKWRCANAAIEVPTSVRDVLAIALLHAIRNTVDHGIGNPEQRMAMGRPEHGVFDVAISVETGSLIFVVSDDGAGPNLEEIARLAEQRSLVSSVTLKKMSAEEKLDLVFRPGFSTRHQASLTGGRGVGLDAVRSAVQAVHGKVNAFFVAGGGFGLSFKIPLKAVALDVRPLRIGTRVLYVPETDIEVLTDPRGFDPKRVQQLATSMGEPRSLQPCFVRVKGRDSSLDIAVDSVDPPEFRHFRRLSGEWSNFGDDFTRRWMQTAGDGVLACRSNDGGGDLALLIDCVGLMKFLASAS